MALVTRTLTNAGAPLYSPDGDLLVGVKINFQLMDMGGRPSDAWDATTNERVGGDVIVATTDTAGVFSVDLWPNTRGNRATKYKCRVQFDGFREFSGIVEDVPGELLWVDFMLGGASMAAQDMSAIAAAIASHVASADPHTQYAKEADLGGAALLDVGATTGTVAAGDDARLLAVGGKVDKITGKGLSTEDYSTTEKSKLAGIAAGATANATDAQLRDRTTHTGAQDISTVTGLQSALDALVPASTKGSANGVASLDAGGKVPAGQLPSYVDDVLEASSLAAFPATGETGKIYVALDTNKVYRWTGSVYIEISPTAGNADTATKLATARTISATGDAAWSVSFDGSGNATAAMTLAASGAAAGTYKSVTVDAKGRVTGGTNPTLTKTDVGLGNVDNVSDVNKPVSTAQAAAIATATAIHPFLLIGA